MTAMDTYHATLAPEDREICRILFDELDLGLPGAERRIWHAHPVWFLAGNPIAGYSKLKDGVRLLFWSGQSFDEPLLKPEGKFKAAEVRFSAPDQIVVDDLRRWLARSIEIQWDYRNLIRRKGHLERLT
jgi:hypothetical protein